MPGGMQASRKTRPHVLWNAPTVEADVVTRHAKALVFEAAGTAMAECLRRSSSRCGRRPRATAAVRTCRVSRQTISGVATIPSPRSLRARQRSDSSRAPRSIEADSKRRKSAPGARARPSTSSDSHSTSVADGTAKSSAPLADDPDASAETAGLRQDRDHASGEQRRGATATRHAGGNGNGSGPDRAVSVTIDPDEASTAQTVTPCAARSRAGAGSEVHAPHQALTPEVVDEHAIGAGLGDEEPVVHVDGEAARLRSNGGSPRCSTKSPSVRRQPLAKKSDRLRRRAVGSVPSASARRSHAPGRQW